MIKSVTQNGFHRIAFGNNDFRYVGADESRWHSKHIYS